MPPPALQLAFRPLFARALKLLVTTTLLLPSSSLFFFFLAAAAAAAAERRCRCLRDATATKEALKIALSCVLEERILFFPNAL
jgi:hypothetical protein